MSAQPPEPELFPMPPSPSPRLQWIKRHGIATKQVRSEWEAWINGTTGSWPLKGYGATEDEALTELAKQAGIRMWHEE